MTFPLWLTKLALTIAIAMMPLQGFAQTLAVLMCQPNMHHSHAGGESDRHQHDGAVEAHSHGGESESTVSHHGSAGNEKPGHFCCNMVVSGLPPAVHSLDVPHFPSLIPPPVYAGYLVFLEPPQRPPRA